MDDYYSWLIKQSSLDDFSLPLEAKNKAAKITHHHRADHLTETACNLRLMIQRRIFRWQHIQSSWRRSRQWSLLSSLQTGWSHDVVSFPESIFVYLCFCLTTTHSSQLTCKEEGKCLQTANWLQRQSNPLGEKLDSRRKMDSWFESAYEWEGETGDHKTNIPSQTSKGEETGERGWNRKSRVEPGVERRDTQQRFWRWFSSPLDKKRDDREKREVTEGKD